MNTKRIKLTCFVLAVLIVVLLGLSGSSTPIEKEVIQNYKPETELRLSPVNAIKSEEREVLSYVDVFQHYYNQVKSEAKRLNITDICEFDEFCENYYSSGMDLPIYTETVVQKEIYNNIDSDTIETFKSSFEDADYILSANDYDMTPATDFQRLPMNYAYDYSLIQNGDIVLETETILFNAGHTAIVYDVQKSGACGIYVQTIEAVGGGVQFGFLDDTRIVDYGVKILRVYNTTLAKINQVKYFCYMQLGKPYSPAYTRLNTDILSESWYCSELVYAAYLYAGIDIGVKTKDGKDVYLTLGCLPKDILEGRNTYVELLYGFINIYNFGKTGKKWNIRVKNYMSESIVIEYNAKLCFKSDAMNWTGLKDIKSFTLNAGRYQDVEISTNWFADYVVFSWTKPFTRYITYATDLKDNGDMMVKNVIKYGG